MLSHKKSKSYNRYGDKDDDDNDRWSVFEIFIVGKVYIHGT